MSKTLLRISGFFLLILLIVSLQVAIDRRRVIREELVEELLYFPSGDFIQGKVGGFDLLVADWIWLRAIQYYGHHRLTDAKFKYLGHILDVLTTLDPRFIHAYTFGSLLLTHDAGEPLKAFQLLKKGREKNPHRWEIPFMEGFIHYVFLKRYREAVRSFRLSSHLPDSPDMTRRFAAFAAKKGGETRLSLELWMELYQTSKNPYEKETALRYVKQLKKKEVEGLLATYVSQRGTYPLDLSELLSLHPIGELKSLFEAPDGDRLYYNRKTHEVFWNKEKIKGQ